jgi:hypothetical protein
MRHFGAPARLLDCSYSFWVALYFALEKMQRAYPCVWALDSEEFVGPFRSLLSGHSDLLALWEADMGITRTHTFNQLFVRQSGLALVGVVNPFRLNERLVVQQGVFLCPGDVSKTFEENLTAVVSNSNFTGRLLKLVITGSDEARKEMLFQLHKMNMNHATLFPGLQGFAESLRTRLVKPEVLLPPS